MGRHKAMEFFLTISVSLSSVCLKIHFRYTLKIPEAAASGYSNRTLYASMPAYADGFENLLQT